MADSDTSNSSPSSLLPRQSCQCGVRMASVKKDPHLKCTNCIGFLCEIDSCCEGSKDWSDNIFTEYIKNRVKLTQKRESKCKARVKGKLESARDLVVGQDSAAGGRGLRVPSSDPGLGGGSFPSGCFLPC